MLHFSFKMLLSIVHEMHTLFVQNEFLPITTGSHTYLALSSQLGSAGRTQFV